MHLNAPPLTLPLSGPEVGMSGRLKVMAQAPHSTGDYHPPFFPGGGVRQDVLAGFSLLSKI